ncbi:MAG TPA: hypothetical protein VIM11_19755 [Tepidisphaeraceae bacterium]
MSDAIPPQLPPPIPIPAEALSYSTGAIRGRPGLIVVIGILSIVLACMSGIVSFLTCVYGLIFYAMISASSSSSMFSFAPPAATVATPPVQPAKLSMGDASVAVNALRSVLELDGPRIRELDKLIRAHGREILGTGTEDQDDFDAPPITDPGVRESLREHHPAADADGAAVFVTAKGRVEVYRDRAVFVSADGSHAINTSAANNSDSAQTNETAVATQPAATEPATSLPATTQGTGTTLSAAEVRHIIKLIKQNSSKPPRAAELAAIEAQLSAADQAWVTPGSASPVNSVIPAPDGLLVQFELGMLKVGPKGQIISSIPTNPFAGFANLHQLRSPLAMLIGEAVASLGLAIYLLIVGILVCRSTFASPGLLRVFAWIKIPLVFAWVWSVGWLIHTSFLLSSPSSGAGATGWAITWGIVLLVFGLAFPVGILISLRTRQLRDYFKFNAV